MELCERALRLKGEMSAMRIVYMGTPDFAVPALVALIEAGHEIVGVVTQKDKPKGRGGKMQFPPVKEEAVKHDIEVFQPDRMKDADSIEWVKRKNPDAIVVAAFGQILPKEVLDIPKYGCLNIHASLLPRLRGAAPIQQAVIDGDSESGITIMQMDEGLDTGDILLVKKVKLAKDETGGSLFEKLSLMGGPLVCEALSKAEKGELTRTPQSGETSYAGMLNKKMGHIDFSKSAELIERLVRGLNPWPSAYSYLDGKLIKIWECSIAEDSLLEEEGINLSEYEQGDIVKVSKDYIYVKTGKDNLIIKSIQPEGKKRMDTGAFLRGCKLEPGMKLA